MLPGYIAGQARDLFGVQLSIHTAQWFLHVIMCPEYEEPLACRADVASRTNMHLAHDAV